MTETCELFPKFTRFHAIMEAMDFTNRRWLLTAMGAFGEAAVELKRARLDCRNRVAHVAGTERDMLHVEGMARDLATREALFDTFGHRLMEIREEFRPVLSADSNPWSEEQFHVREMGLRR